MLSAGERPQPAMTNGAAVVDTTRGPVNKSPLSNTHNSMWTKTSAPQPEQIQHIWVVTGPAGCGKSTVGKSIQQALGVPFLEGDDFHPLPNKEKMSSGIPLTDADRWDWLISLRNAAISALSPSEANNFHPPSGVVVACSALKQKYRDVMRVAAYGSPSVQIHFIYLKLDEQMLLQRVMNRQAHYMKSSMVQSQLQDLEEPLGEWDALTVDVRADQGEVQKEVLGLVAGVLAGYHH
ncbi:thermoresistant gluconokinase family protein [Aspergillus sclerotioniger CBS 115572]|uniref:Gluconokinase n=1 Tax=Aspergillus sclerotioniger CBS 115572 TaxID=1450535 RepID=A0A317XBR6_9EURO|nr:thermoresistant gluconokinase family protein [Aspergillus sclerotioniger CBS 115572]PWY95057.1 thermoresistant gluconokinase family protein [Aspergillus sclerotioniger CBS 115572]